MLAGVDLRAFGAALAVVLVAVACESPDPGGEPDRATAPHRIVAAAENAPPEVTTPPSADRQSPRTETDAGSNGAAPLQRVSIPACARRLHSQNAGVLAEDDAREEIVNFEPRPIDVIFRLNTADDDYTETRDTLLRLMRQGGAPLARETADPEDDALTLFSFKAVPSDVVTFVADEMNLATFPGNLETVSARREVNVEAARRSGIKALSRTFGVYGADIRIAMHEVGSPQAEHGDMDGLSSTFRQDGLQLSTDAIRPMVPDGATKVCSAIGKSRDLGAVCHATHVMGTLAAKGNAGEAAGMAQQAIVVAAPPLNRNNWNDARPSGVHIANHSYGYFCEGADCKDTKELEWIYRKRRSVADQSALDGAPLQVFAAGNNRARYPKNLFPCGTEQEPYGTISGAATSKSALTVGSLADNEILRVSRYSNVGPTLDGRLKPEVVANGEWLYSIGIALDDNFPAARWQARGTSMASPVVAGGGGLLQEMAREYRTDGAYLSSHALRATLINGACALPTNAGNQKPGACAGADIGPTYESGYGEINALVSGCSVAGVNGEVMDTLVIRPGEKMQFEFFREGADAPMPPDMDFSDVRAECFADLNLAVTMTWLDDPGEILMQDIDMHLLTPGGDKIEPWTLDPWTPSKPAVRGVNVRDTVEKITLSSENAEGGRWVLVVEPTRINRSVEFSIAASGLIALDSDN